MQLYPWHLGPEGGVECVVDALLLVGLFGLFDSSFEGARRTGHAIQCYCVTVIASWSMTQLCAGLKHLI